MIKYMSTYLLVLFCYRHHYLRVVGVMLQFSNSLYTYKSSSRTSRVWQFSQCELLYPIYFSIFRFFLQQHKLKAYCITIVFPTGIQSENQRKVVCFQHWILNTGPSHGIRTADLFKKCFTLRQGLASLLNHRI